MTEELPLKEETAPSSEPMPTSGLPESDKKRVMIGSAIGGAIFLGVLIAIIVLVSTEEAKPHPNPKPPTPVVRYPYYNPYIVDAVDQRNEHLLEISLINDRHNLEGGATGYQDDRFGFVPIVKDTYENAEPPRLNVEIREYDEHMVRFLYTEPDLDRWHVPYYGNHSDPYELASRYTHTPLGFRMAEDVNNSFQWTFLGKLAQPYPILSTIGCRLQYFDKYLEFEGIIDRDFAYGMGERIESFHLKNDNYSLWNRNSPSTVDADTEIGLFGSHPFLLTRASDDGPDDFVGFFMRNSNAMIFSLWDHIHNGTIINYKMVGGVIDLYMFHTADSQYILRKYHSVIGRPYLPPVWAMGLQIARAGYVVDDYIKIINNSQEHKLPFDALWADTTLNQNYKTFTVDTSPGKFEKIKQLVTEMHDVKLGYDLRFVAIANPPLAVDNSYEYYAKALKENLLIMSAYGHEKVLHGRTAAGTSVWLDFFIYASTQLWGDGLHKLHDMTLFDGIWISDNEIYQYESGEIIESTTDADEQYQIPSPFHNKSEFSYLQYRPTIDPLETDTLSMTGYQYGDLMFHKQFFTHNLFSIQIVQATFESLYSIFEDKRFMIASRASWPGSGQFSSHWLDGNHETWDAMISSISSILNFNMFGIPHVGAPIGGLYGNCSGELLVRWYELGAFYPLMLIYTESNTNHKDPFANETFMEEIRNALVERYALIRFMYTKMFEAYLWGGSVIHPLFFDFTNDTQVYKREILDRTFMWASTLYIIPALVPHLTTNHAYLPNWRWYDLRTYEMIVDYNPYLTDGNYHDFDQPLGSITVLIKGGSIIPYQHYTREAKIMNVVDLEKIPAQIIVAPDHNGKAIGSMVVDSEGIRPYPDPESHTYRHYTFTYMNQIFRINKLAGFDFYGEFEFDYFWELLILDIFDKHQVDYVCMMDMYMKKRELQYAQSHATSSITIHDSDRMDKMPMYSLESIVWGSIDQHDFCKYQVHIDRMELSNEARVLSGTIDTTDPAAYRLQYDFVARAINNYIVYFTIAKNEKDIVEWKVPEIVPESIKSEVKATRTLDGVGFGTSRVGEEFFFEMSEEDDPHDFLLTTRNQPFVYVRNFIQIKFMIAGRHIFGLGERVGKFELQDGVYSIWNYDYMHEETGIPPGNNMYGSHPFYMIHTHNPKDFAGVFFLTSNPMDVRVKHIGMQTEVDHILTGGIIELFLLGKGSAEKVLREYHYLIGKPTPLPFWAFGYHQSRWGYKDIMHLREVVREFDVNVLPLDAVWMDKDFMVRYKSFTVDTKKWYGLKEFVEELHTKHIQFVAIVDAAIAEDYDYPVFTRGLELDLYIKSSFTHLSLIGITWAGYSVWVDFLKPTSTSYWEQNLHEFHELVPFDGIWLDMNEPSNFCDGECSDGINYYYYFFPLDYYDDLYYNPTHRPVEDNTVSMEAYHYGDAKLANEYNYHNLYGYYQSKITANFFINTLNTRPFIISSATFPGIGKYAAHWLGDNYSSWLNMEYSIAGMLNFNMFGIPFVGANICGYSGNSTVELCARWMQLGSFYPLMRNHNSPEGKPQEPYVNPDLLAASKKALQLRYSLVRYIYTEYMHTVLRGGSLIKPLIFLFPEDNETYANIDTTFMMGPALRITPVLTEKTVEVETYFPNADWFHFGAPDFSQIMTYNHTTTKGKYIKVSSSAYAGTVAVHIRGGTILPYQEVGEGVVTVTRLHEMPLELLVVPNHVGRAVGEVFFDSESHKSFETDHQDIMIHMLNNEINFNTTSGHYDAKYNHTDMHVGKIYILNAIPYKKITNVKAIDTSNHDIPMKAPVYDDKHHILTLESSEANKLNVMTLKQIHWTRQ